MRFYGPLILLLLLVTGVVSCQQETPGLKNIVEFYDAIRHDDVNRVKSYLDRYKDIARWEYTIGERFNSIMAAAVFTDDVGLVKLLLKNGGAFYYHNKIGDPVLCAIYNHRSKILNYLLQNKANLTYRDGDGISAPTELALSFTPESAKILEPYIKGMLNDKTNNGATPLYIALTKNNVEAVRWFLDEGVSADDFLYVPWKVGTYYDNWNLMSSLVSAKQNQVLEEFFKHLKKPLTLTNLVGDTLLYVAAALGNSEIIPVLAKYMPNVNVVAKDGNNAIQTAVDFKDYSVIPALISIGVDPKHRNKTGKTALEMYREKQKHVDPKIVHLLSGA